MLAYNPQCIHHLSCQVNIYFYINIDFCLCLVILYIWIYVCFLSRNIYIRICIFWMGLKRGTMLVYFFFSLLAISMPNCLSRTQTQRSQNSPAYRGNTHLEPVTTLTLMHMKLKRRQRQIGRELEKEYWDDVLASHP